MTFVITCVGSFDGTHTVDCASIDEARGELRRAYRETVARDGRCVAAYIARPDRDRTTECFMRINDDGSEDFYSCYE